MNKRMITLFVALLFSAASVFASSIISIPTDGTKTFVVDTKVWKSEHVSISIQDNLGTFLFEDTYTTTDVKMFSLKNLPKGIYTLKVENEFKTTIQSFEITKTQVILDSEEETLYKPSIKFQPDFIDLNFLSKNEDVSVKIYHENKEVFSLDFENQMTINKRFDINNLPIGKYTFSISSKADSFSKSFQKK